MPDIFTSPSTNKATNTTESPTQKLTSFKQNPKRSLLGKTLSAYLFMPDDIRFETQEPGETIILLLRKHWITNLLWLLISGILIVLPLFLFPALTLSGTTPSIPVSLMSFFILGWYLITFSYIFVNFILWYFTVSIVTNERIIDIDFINLLNKKFAETRINRIEDVTMRTGGFIRAFFDYGDVLVQTAAKEVQFEFLAVPHPEKVVRTINELMGKTEEGGE